MAGAAKGARAADAAALTSGCLHQVTNNRASLRPYLRGPDRRPRTGRASQDQLVGPGPLLARTVPDQPALARRLQIVDVARVLFSFASLACPSAPLGSRSRHAPIPRLVGPQHVRGKFRCSAGTPSLLSGTDPSAGFQPYTATVLCMFAAPRSISCHIPPSRAPTITTPGLGDGEGGPQRWKCAVPALPEVGEVPFHISTLLLLPPPAASGNPLMLPFPPPILSPWPCSKPSRNRPSTTRWRRWNRASILDGPGDRELLPCCVP